MKKILRSLVAFGIFCGILYVIYLFLPEYPHNMIKSFIQPAINMQAKIRIGQVKKMDVNIKGLEDVTYLTALEKNTGMSCWVYEQDESTGEEIVIYMGRGAGVNMKEAKDYGGKLYTSATIKFEFHIKGSKVEVIPYIDGKSMNIKDGKHVEKNKEVLKSIVSQLYGGIQDE